MAPSSRDRKFHDQIADLQQNEARMKAEIALLHEAVSRIIAPHYDEYGVIDLYSASMIVGRDQNDRLQLKGSFISTLEGARKISILIKP